MSVESEIARNVERKSYKLFDSALDESAGDKFVTIKTVKNQLLKKLSVGVHRQSKRDQGLIRT